jgi:hypothetical protein
MGTGFVRRCFSLRTISLPGRLGRGEDLPDTDSPDDPPEFVAVGAIPIPQQVARLGAVSGEGLPDLLCGPGCGRMGGDVEMENASPVVGENHEAEQVRFSRDILRIIWMTSRLTSGRPLFSNQDFQRQKYRSPWRCHRRTVSGLTTNN